MKTRIALAKDAFNKLKPIMKDRNISLKTKMRISSTYVWSVMLYGCESWTVNNEITNRLAAAEMWFCEECCESRGRIELQTRRC